MVGRDTCWSPGRRRRGLGRSVSAFAGDEPKLAAGCAVANGRSDYTAAQRAAKRTPATVTRPGLGRSGME